MNNDRLINERSRDIGNFLVGRLLPFKKKRAVGPFTFIDHMGPATIEPGNYFDIDQHPHIGLSTLTYLIEGEVEHRDSTGAVQIVKPGDVGFMTAGKGVTHTERCPQNMRDGQQYTMHGYQVWVALPKQHEEVDPHFQFIDRSQLPEINQADKFIRVIAGEAFGLKSPLKVYSDLFMVDIQVKTSQKIPFTEVVQGELAIVVVNGKVIAENTPVVAGQMLVSKTNDVCELEVEANSRILLFGGKPFEEERHLLWNFVSSDKDRLLKAKDDWINKRFPKVPGDETYIPFP